MKPGDHLVVPLFLGLTHHGIYIGRGRVVHWDSGVRGRVGLFTLLCGPTKARIRETSLGRFTSGCRSRVRRYRLSLDRETVVARARARVGEQGYDLLVNNCEQLATWCKTGRHSSCQVHAARRRAVLAAGLTLGVLVGHAVGSMTGSVAATCLGLLVWVCGVWLRGHILRSVGDASCVAYLGGTMSVGRSRAFGSSPSNFSHSP
jgi:hypothetical protein